MTRPTPDQAGRAGHRVSPAGGSAVVVVAVVLVSWLGAGGALVAAVIWACLALGGCAVRAGARAVVAADGAARAVQARIAVPTAAAAAVVGVVSWRLPVPADHGPAVLLGAVAVAALLGSATLAEAFKAWITRTPRTSYETWSDPPARTGDDR